jgi:transposase
MEGPLMMSRKERDRLRILARVKRGELSLKEAAELSEVSYRQCRRQYQRWRELGDRGLVHQGRGRPSNRSGNGALRAGVLARYQERYPDFGPTLAAEKLMTDGLVVNHETLRRWLLQAGVWQTRRKRAKHRSWRERRAHFGELLQMDGSHHEWFEKRAPGRSCLMKLIDDATSQRLVLLSEQETIFSAMELLWKWIERSGIPRALYTDKKNVYVVDEKTRKLAAESGDEVLTQFGRACKKLGIEIITAHSPQAKGRVERSHGTYQDRLVKELRLNNCNTIAEANELLEQGYGQQLSDKFAVAPRLAADYHRAAKGYDLAAILCIEEERNLSADWIVRFENQYFQLQPPRKTLPGRGQVLVQRYLDGSWHFRQGEQELAYTVLPARPQPTAKPKKRKPRKQGTTVMEKYMPPANHPWRRSLWARDP